MHALFVFMYVMHTSINNKVTIMNPRILNYATLEIDMCTILVADPN